MLRLMRRKAQSTAEYAIVIGLVIAAAVAMQVYVKRGLQAKVRGAVDFNDPTAVNNPLGGQMLGKTTQFEPDYTTTSGEGMHTIADTVEKTTTEEAGGVTRAIIGTSTTSKTGIQVTK